MQQIERYGVIALVFLLVTIVAISFWGDSKSPGFWSRLTGKNQPKPAEVVQAAPAPLPFQIADPNVPLSPGNLLAAPQEVDTLGAPQPLNAMTNPGLGNLHNDVIVDSQVPPATPPPATIVVDMPAPVRSTSLPSTPRTQPTTTNGGEYVVKSGDSLARIARTQLGQESRWQEIAALNPKVDPKRLDVGQKLVMPSGAAPVVAKAMDTATKSVTKPTSTPAPTKKATKSAAATSICTVQKGDTLRSIARRELGDERRWKEIVGANPGIDPNKLAIGARLKLPSGREELVLADKPSANSSSSNRPRVR